MTALHRRSFITGLISLVAAPAIVRAGSLMPVRTMIEPYGVGPMMAAMRAINLFDQIDFDLVVGEIIKIHGVPHRFLRGYP